MRGDQQTSVQMPECGGREAAPTELSKCYGSHLSSQQTWLLPKNTMERKEFFSSIISSLYPVLRSLPTNKAKLPASWRKKKKNGAGGGGWGGEEETKKDKSRKIGTPFYWPNTNRLSKSLYVVVTMTHLEKSVHSNERNNTRQDPGIPHYRDMKAYLTSLISVYLF